MKYTKKIILQWSFRIGFYLFCLVTAYIDGRKHMFYLLLLPIPLLFLGWGLFRLLSDGTISNITKNFTDEERAESSRLAQSYIGKMGIFVLAPFAIICTLFYMLYGVTSIIPYIILFCIVMVFAAPFMFKQWKTMRAFTLSTEYAKKQGYNKITSNK